MLKSRRLVHCSSRLLISLIMTMLTLPDRRLAWPCFEFAIVNFEITDILVVGAEEPIANAARVCP